MKKKIFIVAAVIFSGQLQAQKPAQVISGDTTKNLDEVVITANKYPQKQSSTGKVLTVINRDQLEKNTGRSLAQVLNDQAGIIVRDDSAGIAGFVLNACAFNRKCKMQRSLCGVAMNKVLLVHDWGQGGVIA